MQLAQGVDQEVLRKYHNGSITIENAAAPRLSRGTLQGLRVIGEWVEVTMTFDEYAIGTIEGRHDATWKSADGHRDRVILQGPGHVDDHDRLVFKQQDGRRSSALIELPR